MGANEKEQEAGANLEVKKETLRVFTDAFKRD